MKRMKIHILLSAIALILPSLLTGQTLQVKPPVRFLALGDSYTIGHSVPANERWPIQLRDSLESRGVNVQETNVIATTGWRTDNLLDAITDKKLDRENYNLVSLLIGVNDQYQRRPIAHYEPLFRELLDSCLRYAAFDTSSVFIVSIPDYAYTPFGQRSINPNQISLQLDEYNAINKRVAEEYGVQYFDITPISREGLDEKDLVAPDELHPSSYQYTLWVQKILNYLEENSLISPSKSKLTNELKIYPLPARQMIRVEGLEEMNLDQIRVLNVKGQIQKIGDLSDPQDMEIDISQLNAGTYFLQVFQKNLLVAKGRFVVQ
ncbi:MAG: T9SS type A sorting domain-containing protein [Saprospiraceae bacterium]|nr:T9SS type A sorting domain-containing protein [Saprospiraceae bacterium]